MCMKTRMEESCTVTCLAFERAFKNQLEFSGTELGETGGVKRNWVRQTLFPITGHALLAKNVIQAEKNEGLGKSLLSSAPQVIICINTQERGGYCKRQWEGRKLF